MLHPVDEHIDIERQVIRILYFEIARGTWEAGERCPDAMDIARGLLINPRHVESACRRLAEEGLLLSTSGGFVVSDDATALARHALARCVKEDVKTLRRRLRSAGLSEKEMDDIFKECPDE